jgi:thiamine biosynthesis lipoprotein
MGTTVTLRAPRTAVELLGHDVTEHAFARAAAWFHMVESVCNRFDPASELSRLSTQPGVPTPASDLLFRSVDFALALAAQTGGAFDPTIGKRLEGLGFDRSYVTGDRVTTAIPSADDVSYRDVLLDPSTGTITLARPLLLDLGAIAKGLAIDLAARELAPLESFLIDAGGDLWLA